MLRVATRVGQCQCYRKGWYEVDIADVDEHLGGVVGEFAEGEVCIDVRIGLVEDRGLNKARPRIEEELQLCILREPDPSSSNARYSHSD